MNPQIITNTLESMTRKQLRATAQRLNIPQGRNKSDTIANLLSSISQNSTRYTVQFTIRPNSDPKAVTAPTIFSKKLRTHKPDKIMVPV